MPAVSATATSASATRISISVKPRAAPHCRRHGAANAMRFSGSRGDDERAVARLANTNVTGSLRPVGAQRNDRLRRRAARPRVARRAHAHAGGQAVRRERSSSSVSGASGHSASRRQKRHRAFRPTRRAFRPHLRARGCVFERTGEPSRLAVERSRRCRRRPSTAMPAAIARIAMTTRISTSVKPGAAPPRPTCRSAAVQIPRADVGVDAAAARLAVGTEAP